MNNECGGRRSCCLLSVSKTITERKLLMCTLKTFCISTVFSAFLLLSVAVGAFAAAQTTCPVMGGTIVNKELFADYKGERVYFCCMACPEQFAKDPEKYIKKLKEMGQEPEKIETNK
jgi:YHS domain-containing protein